MRSLDALGNVLKTWSFADLLQDAEQLGKILVSRHSKGARLAVYANNVPQWVLLEFAAALAGMVLVTVNPSFQHRELKYVLEQSGAEALYYVEEFRGNAMGEIARAVCGGSSRRLMLIELTDDRALYDGTPATELPDVRPAEIAQIQYTSGTTGFPKGALLHHNGLARNAINTVIRAGLKEGSVYVHHMPLFHTTGCAVLVLGGVAVGSCMLLAPNFDPRVAVKVIERERADFLSGVPTMLVALMDVVDATGADVSSVQRIISGGAMVAPELCRRARSTFGAPIQIVYGQTETSPAITQTWYEDTLEDLTETTGQPVPHVEVAILAPGTEEVLPTGMQGEICCRGYNVMAGYNDNPDATAETITATGWLRTGDLGTMDARGYVKISGRVKEMIIRGGENLFPVEIENAVLEHGSVAEAAVVGVADPVLGERVICFLKSSGRHHPSEAELKSFIRERLSPQKTPAEWIWVQAWPLTGSGKIQKFKLRQLYEDGQFAKTGFAQANVTEES